MAYVQQMDEDEESEQRSTWFVEKKTLIVSNALCRRRAYGQIRIVLPYIWPRGSVLLQLRVIACVLLLVVGRLVNVCVPVLNKYIG